MSRSHANSRTRCASDPKAAQFCVSNRMTEKENIGRGGGIRTRDPLHPMRTLERKF